MGRKLQSWKADEENGDLSKYIASDVFPAEITIKIDKLGQVMVAIDDAPMGFIQRLVLVADCEHPIPHIEIEMGRPASEIEKQLIEGAHDDS